MVWFIDLLLSRSRQQIIEEGLGGEIWRLVVVVTLALWKLVVVVVTLVLWRLVVVVVTLAL